MKILFVRVAIIATLLIGCSPKEKVSTLDKDILGEWRNIYLKISLDAGASGDTVKITECDSAHWETMLGIKPIHTFYKEDGSYTSEYYTLQDSLFMTNTGKWKISGDTLTMEQEKPKPAVYKLKTVINEGVATFEGLIDFDSDGIKDDFYLGRQRKQSSKN